MTTKVDLKKIKIDFGYENGKKIYMEHLNPLSNKEKMKTLGFKMKRANCPRIPKYIKEGEYMAFRFKKMCKELDVEPKEIFSKYEPKVLKLKGWGKNKKWIELEESLKEAVFSEICD